MAFSKFVSMKKTPEEKVEEVEDFCSRPSIANVADYPYGLAITLTHEELDKLGLDYDCDVGDMIDLRAFAEVTSVSKRMVNDKPEVRVELQIRDMAVENESDEEPGED